MKTLQSLITQLEASYEEGQPLHVKGTPTRESVFKIMSEDEFSKMNQSDVQELLRKQHIVVTGMQQKDQSFEQALLDVAPLDWTTGIQGEHVVLLA